MVRNGKYPVFPDTFLLHRQLESEVAFSSCHRQQRNLEESKKIIRVVKKTVLHCIYS